MNLRPLGYEPSEDQARRHLRATPSSPGQTHLSALPGRARTRSIRRDTSHHSCPSSPNSHRTQLGSNRENYDISADQTATRAESQPRRNERPEPRKDPDQGIQELWSQLVSNQRPLACEASALPLSYGTVGIFGAAGVPFRTRRNFNTPHPYHTKSGLDLGIHRGRASEAMYNYRRHSAVKSQ